MKKSKIIVPALAVLLLSTAASVTGTVAWFTANRVFNMKAGEFAVVSTKNNLEAVVTAGVGTQVAGDPAKDIALADNDNTLTDASFNHNSILHDIIEPDENGLNLDDLIALADANGTNLNREGKIFSAYTWNITFKVSMSTSSTTKVGLYFNTHNSWAHKVVTFEEGHTITAEEAAATYANEDLSDASMPFTASHVIDATEAAKKYYAAEPEDTGKGLRIAFVPTNVPYQSMGYTKIWAPHQDDSKCFYINDSSINEYDTAATYAKDDVVKHEGNVYKAKVASADPAGAWTSANWEQSAALADYKTAVGATTSSLTQTAGGVDTAAVDVACASALMEKDDDLGIPSSQTAATTLSTDKNYLGYFGNNAGGSVSLTYTCIAWYEGTDENIVNTSETVYETMVSFLEFGTVSLSD